MADVVVNVTYISEACNTALASKYVLIPWGTGETFEEKLSQLTADFMKNGDMLCGPNPLTITALHQTDSEIVNGVARSQIFDELFPPSQPDWAKLPDYPAWYALMADPEVYY